MKKPQLAIAILFLLLMPAMLFAESKEQPVVEKLDIAPKHAVFEDATRAKPIGLTSAEDAGKYFEGEALKQINKQVNWTTQQVLIFAWRGSGGDRMTTEVKEGPDDSLIVQYIYTAGRTRDLRPHTYVYAVRKGVKWEVK